MKDITGGSAFPVPATELHGTDAGMTLRDYFAAKAMHGDWARDSNAVIEFAEDGSHDPYGKAAEVYYRMADAMLKARGE